ncbi:MAG: hypothetical protein ACREK1_01640 [Longimicrobiales bacterium]
MLTSSMYRNCIFCSAPFGTNEALESFPVGRQLAFDASKGRLWAVCPVCARWNLSPIEERWESVEAADKLFRDARLRVQSENVGLAQLPDGTRLVRVGSAVPGELAAWRYGRQLLHRRKRYFVTGGIGVAAGVAAYGGLMAMGTGFLGMWFASSWLQTRRQQKIVHRLNDRDGTHAEVVIRRWHLDGVSLYPAETGGDLEVHVRDAHRRKPAGWDGKVKRNSGDVVVLSGDDAGAMLARAMVYVNRRGATHRALADANRVLSNVGSAEDVLRVAAARRMGLGDKAGRDPDVIKGTNALVRDGAERGVGASCARRRARRPRGGVA